jgi:hypothetical protein
MKLREIGDVILSVVRVGKLQGNVFHGDPEAVRVLGRLSLDAFPYLEGVREAIDAGVLPSARVQHAKDLGYEERIAALEACPDDEAATDLLYGLRSWDRPSAEGKRPANILLRRGLLEAMRNVFDPDRHPMLWLPRWDPTLVDHTGVSAIELAEALDPLDHSDIMAWTRERVRALDSERKSALVNPDGFGFALASLAFTSGSHRDALLSALLKRLDVPALERGNWRAHEGVAEPWRERYDHVARARIYLAEMLDTGSHHFERDNELKEMIRNVHMHGDRAAESLTAEWSPRPLEDIHAEYVECGAIWDHAAAEVGLAAPSADCAALLVELDTQIERFSSIEGLRKHAASVREFGEYLSCPDCGMELTMLHVELFPNEGARCRPCMKEHPWDAIRGRAFELPTQR